MYNQHVLKVLWYGPLMPYLHEQLRELMGDCVSLRDSETVPLVVRHHCQEPCPLTAAWWLWMRPPWWPICCNTQSIRSLECCGRSVSDGWFAEWFAVSHPDISEITDWTKIEHWFRRFFKCSVQQCVMSWALLLGTTDNCTMIKAYAR